MTTPGAHVSSSATITALVMIIVVGSSLAHAQAPGPPNDCSHPYWSSTLRCRVIALSGGTGLPQPNASDRPTNVAAIKEYTRVFLGRPRSRLITLSRSEASPPPLRCVDGTRPLLYVAPAVCSTAGGCAQPGGGTVPYGSPMVSNDWIISFVGGGSCHARDLDGDGIFEDGSTCTNLYPEDKSGMTTAFDPPMQNLQGDTSGSGGLMSRSPALNPVFAAYNSVRVEKCSHDRYNGRAEHANVEGQLAGNTFRYTLFNHGQWIAEATIQELRNGLVYTTWADINSDGTVDDVRTRLPRLSDARQVVFVGHSAGAHGLRYNVDRLAELVKGGRDIDVRAVFDSHFLPSIEGEATFAPGLNGDAYTDQWSGRSSGSGASFTYDGETYHRESRTASQFKAWNTSLDDSCLAAHSLSTRWKCFDRQHVLFNHVSTPMFIREDFTDPNIEHTDGGLGFSIPWALLPGCTYPIVEAVPQCDARFAAATEHRVRLTRLAETLLADIGTRSEIARDVDISVSGSHVPSVVVWMPRCGSHEGVYESASFFNTRISEDSASISMYGAMVGFVNASPLDTTAWRIHGTALGKTMTSNCPP